MSAYSIPAKTFFRKISRCSAPSMKKYILSISSFFMPLIGQLFCSDARTPLVIERVIEELLSDAESQYSNISSDMFNKEKNNEA